MRLDGRELEIMLETPIKFIGSSGKDELASDVAMLFRNNEDFHKLQKQFLQKCFCESYKVSREYNRCLNVVI
jgi:hypothetical protein